MSNRPAVIEAASARARAPEGLSAKITTLRPAQNRERAELIRDVIDAFRRLRSSVHRFVQMFAAASGDCVAEADSGTSLHPLLSTLARQGDAASFTRRRELRRAIKAARQLEPTRDAIFSDSFSHDADAMRKTVSELERLDAIFVGLCVEHVMDQHRHKPDPAFAPPPHAACTRRAPQVTVRAPQPSHADAPVAS